MPNKLNLSLTEIYDGMDEFEQRAVWYVVQKERERIIKELEKEIVPTYLLCEADTYNKAIHKAIEIVKRGGKE